MTKWKSNHRSNDEVSGNKQSGEYQDPDMALIDNVKNHTHIGNWYLSDVLMIIIWFLKKYIIKI